MSITGGCICGQVRFSIDAEPVTARACWCRLCQYLGAGSSTVNAVFPADAVTVTGDLAAYSSTADSGNRMHRRFCPACGTHIFSDAETRPHIRVIRIGTLDDPGLIRPQMTIWTTEAPDWACFDPAIPSYEGPPPA
jgi:hypothetical protein